MSSGVLHLDQGVGRGTGLGLSIVHELAAQLSGALTIRSKPSLGTNVELWLPAAEVEVQQTPHCLNTSKRTLRDRRAGPSYLSMTRTLYGRYAGSTGKHRRKGQLCGCSPRRVAERLSTDLVVADHLRPGLTGTDLAQILRAQPPTPLPFASVRADMEGTAPYLPRLTRPFRKSELAASLLASIT